MMKAFGPQARCVTKLSVVGEIVLLPSPLLGSMVWVLLMKAFGPQARCVAKLRVFDEFAWLPSPLLDSMVWVWLGCSGCGRTVSRSPEVIFDFVLRSGATLVAANVSCGLLEAMLSGSGGILKPAMFLEAQLRRCGAAPEGCYAMRRAHRRPRFFGLLGVSGQAFFLRCNAKRFNK